MNITDTLRKISKYRPKLSKKQEGYLLTIIILGSVLLYYQVSTTSNTESNTTTPEVSTQQASQHTLPNTTSLNIPKTIPNPFTWDHLSSSTPSTNHPSQPKAPSANQTRSTSRNTTTNLTNTTRKAPAETPAPQMNLIAIASGFNPSAIIQTGSLTSEVTVGSMINGHKIIQINEYSITTISNTGKYHHYYLN